MADDPLAAGFELTEKLAVPSVEREGNSALAHYDLRRPPGDLAAPGIGVAGDRERAAQLRTEPLLRFPESHQLGCRLGLRLRSCGEQQRDEPRGRQHGMSPAGVTEINAPED